MIIRVCLQCGGRRSGGRFGFVLLFVPRLRGLRAGVPLRRHRSAGWPCAGERLQVYGLRKVRGNLPPQRAELVSARARVMVFCSTKDRLKAVTEVCKVGCIKCGRCVKSCPAGAVTLENDRIHINHKVCLTYGPEWGKPAPPRAREEPCGCSVRARL